MEAEKPSLNFEKPEFSYDEPEARLDVYEPAIEKNPRQVLSRSVPWAAYRKAEWHLILGPIRASATRSPVGSPSVAGVSCWGARAARAGS